MGLTVIVFCVTTLAYVFVSVEGQYVLTTSCGVSVQAGGSCTLTCDTQGVAAAGIQWLNGSAPTAITDTDCKNVGNLPKPDYTANCNNAKTEFTLTFTNAIYGRDAVEWACDSAFGGSKSNIIAAGTLVTVPLTLVTITRTSTITCTTLSKPEAEIKLIESTNHQVVKTESNFAEEYGGRMTTLTYNLNDTSSYYCHADNGVVQINSTVSSPSEACRCLCHCDRKTRDIVLLIIEIIILVVILVFLVFNILIGKQVIKCNSKKGAQEHANSKKGAQEHANKISVIICILILVVAAIYGIICVAVTQTEPTIQNAAAVSGQECCCSTCDDNGGDEKKRCEDIATTVLAFGIILIFGAVVLIIAVLILTKIKDLPWINNFLFICGCGCCSSPVPPPNEPGNKESVRHGDDPKDNQKPNESIPLNSGKNTGSKLAGEDPQPAKNSANTTAGPASRKQRSSNDGAKTEDETASNSDVSSSKINVDT